MVGRLVLWLVGRWTCLRLPDEVGKEAGTKCSTLSVQSLQMGKHDFPLHLKVNLPIESLCILFPIFHHFESRICIILISFPLARLPPPLPLPPKAGGTCPPPFTIPRHQKCLGQQVSLSASQGSCYRYSCMMIHQASLGPSLLLFAPSLLDEEVSNAYRMLVELLTYHACSRYSNDDDSGAGWWVIGAIWL